MQKIVPLLYNWTEYTSSQTVVPKIIFIIDAVTYTKYVML